MHTGWERCNIVPLAGPDLRQGLGPVRLGLKEKPAPWGGESLAAPTPTAKSLPALVSSEWPANCFWTLYPCGLHLCDCAQSTDSPDPCITKHQISLPPGVIHSSQVANRCPLQMAALAVSQPGMSFTPLHQLKCCPFFKSTFKTIYNFSFFLNIYLIGCTGSLLQHAGSLIFTVACGIFSYSMENFSCGMRDIVPCPGIQPEPLALGAWSGSHWTSREVPHLHIFHEACRGLCPASVSSQYTKSEPLF